ncbi:hypothetical protein ACFE04_000159 [Oxalis oulophora]
MSWKKIVTLKKLAKKAKVITKGDPLTQKKRDNEYCLLKEFDDVKGNCAPPTPTGFFTVYVGEERERCVVPTGFLPHPLFKMLLDKSYDEVEFEHVNRLVIPCSVSTFHEVVNAIESCNGTFDFGNVIEEFL